MDSMRARLIEFRKYYQGFILLNNKEDKSHLPYPYSMQDGDENTKHFNVLRTTIHKVLVRGRVKQNRKISGTVQKINIGADRIVYQADRQRLQQHQDYLYEYIIKAKENNSFHAVSCSLMYITESMSLSSLSLECCNALLKGMEARKLLWLKRFESEFDDGWQPNS